MKKLLAFLSAICPFCIVKRRFPDTKIGKAIAKVEKGCPCCKAYDDIHKKDKT